MDKKIFCIILNWNGKKFLKDCIGSVRRSSYPVDIVVVDNGSKDGSSEYLEKNYPDVNIIKNTRNLGWTGGNNKGVKFALKKSADAIFILNNDTIIDKKCIYNLANELFSNNELGIVGPKIYLTNKNERRISFAGGKFTTNRYFGIHVGNNKKDRPVYNKTVDTEFITGAAIMIKSEVFNKVGLFDKRYFIYYDEADFCLRARRKGFKIRYVPTATLNHVFSGTVKVGSPFQHYFTTRNHFLFVEKNAPFKVKLIELLRTPKTLIEFLKSPDKDLRKYSILGVRDYFLRKFGERVYW